MLGKKQRSDKDFDEYQKEQEIIEDNELDLEDIIVKKPKELKKHIEPKYQSLKKVGDSIEGLYLGVFPMQWYGQETPMLLFKQENNEVAYIRGSYKILQFLIANQVQIRIYMKITRIADIELSGGRKLADFSFEYDSQFKLGMNKIGQIGSSKIFGLIPESLRPETKETKVDAF